MSGPRRSYDLLPVPPVTSVCAVDGRTRVIHGVTTVVDGVLFSAVWEHDGAEAAAARTKAIALHDLDWYINEFYFFGCGGLNHEFSPSARDVLKAARCSACGAVKRINMVWPDVLAGSPGFTAAFPEDAARLGVLS